MKKSYLMIAAGVFILSACSKTDTFKDLNNQTENSISFATYTTKQTRASENSGIDTKQSALEVHQKSFAVWGYKDAANGMTRVFNKQVVDYNSNAVTGWSYSPLMFWDKAARKYSFYAAAPADLAWVMNDGGTTYAHSTAAGAYTLSLASHVVDGESLNIDEANLPSSPTTGASATWLKSDDTNCDIMISNDIPEYKTYSSAPVNFEFMHILSRLNIAVKIADVLDTDANNDNQKDYIVKLKSVKVFNMRSNGKFNEADASGATLSGGTTLRWSDLDGTAKQKFIGGKGFTATTNADGVQLTTTQKYFYQTLVLPQNVAYELISIDGKAHTGEDYYGVEEYNYVNGTNLNAADYAALTNKTKPATSDLVPFSSETAFDACSEPYLEICYTIMPTYGNNINVVEEFTQYYNLAATFGKNQNSSEGTPAVNQVAFNEGWMNNLIITINPVSISFDAEVWEWESTTDAQHTIH